MVDDVYVTCDELRLTLICNPAHGAVSSQVLQDESSNVFMSQANRFSHIEG